MKCFSATQTAKITINYMAMNAWYIIFRIVLVEFQVEWVMQPSGDSLSDSFVICWSRVKKAWC